MKNTNCTDYFKNINKLTKNTNCIDYFTFPPIITLFAPKI